MHIRVEADGEAQLVDADNFKRFHIEVGDPGMGDDAIAKALASIARCEGSDYWVDVGRLVAISGRSGDMVWQASLRTMLEAAQKFGWASADGQSVKAHVKR